MTRDEAHGECLPTLGVWLLPLEYGLTPLKRLHALLDDVSEHGKHLLVLAVGTVVQVVLRFAGLLLLIKTVR